MEYRICPYCGAALDPGERCDCQEPEQEAGEILITCSLAELTAQLEAEQGERGSAPGNCQAVRDLTLLATLTPQRKEALQP